MRSKKQILPIFIIDETDNGAEESLVTYAYDGRGNLVSETVSDGINGNITKSFTYNNAGLLTNSVIKIGNSVKQNISYEYTGMGQVKAVYESGTLVAAYEYDVLGRQVRAVKANGVTETVKYNAAGLVVSVKNVREKSTTNPSMTVSEYKYTYYYDGNQRTKVDGSGVTSYEYDGLGRLVTAVLPDGTVQEYEFDANGNRTNLTVTDGNNVSVTTYSYDANDRLISEVHDSETTVYAYDFNGNMLSKSDGSVTVPSVTVQEFDLLNRMVSWTDGTNSAVYTYNTGTLRKMLLIQELMQCMIHSRGLLVLDLNYPVQCSCQVV